MKRATLLLLFLAACKKAPARVDAPSEAPQQAVAPTRPLAPSPTQSVTKVWLETDPVQCKANPWDKFTGIGGVIGFFGEKGIKVYDTATITYNQLYGEPVSVCQACNCPAGNALYLWVAQADAPGLQAYGFKPSRVDPLNPDTYVSSRRPPGAPPLASSTPGPKVLGAAADLPDKSVAPARTSSRKASVRTSAKKKTKTKKKKRTATQE